MSVQMYRRQLQSLRHALQQLQLAVDPNTDDSSSEATDIQSAFKETQQQFQQILTLNLDAEIANQMPQMQSLQTEINKQLRLFGIDIVFLQTARHSAKSQQRQTQMGDRLCLIMQYCDRLLEMAMS